MFACVDTRIDESAALYGCYLRPRPFDWASPVYVVSGAGRNGDLPIPGTRLPPRAASAGQLREEVRAAVEDVA